MNNSINVISSNNNQFNIKSSKKIRPYTSKEREKDNKKLVRVLSAGNIKNSKFYQKFPSMSNHNLPSLNNSKSIIFNNKNKNKKQNGFISNNNKYKIELEKLYEQNFHYKKLIRKLHSDIKLIKKEGERKEEILNLKNEEIENIIAENGHKEYYLNSKLPFSEKAKYSLIKKMRNQLKDTEQELNDEIIKNLQLKKNYKYTKYNELQIEQKIINEHNNKILSLIENSEQFKNTKNKELIQTEKFNINFESQIKIINNLEHKYKELDIEENCLKNEIIKYENILNKMTNKVKIIKLKHISLKEQNMKLKKEKNNFLDQNNKNKSLDELNKKLDKVKREYQYNKLKNKKTIEKLINVKKNFKINLEQYKNIENKNILLKNNEKNSNIKNSVKPDEILDNKNDEEYINKLKTIYQKNREKENELEQGLYLFQQAIKRLNDGENINLEIIRESILKSINNKIE